MGDSPEGPNPFPIKTAHKKSTTSNLQILYTEFANRHFVTISEYGKIGSLLEATLDVTPHPTPNPTISTKALLGPPQDPLSHVYATHILSQIHATRPNDTRPLLLGLALKKSRRDEDVDVEQLDRQVFEEVVQLCRDVGVW
ncbi:hypothetical protein SpCBS45565_g00870 [Spizellomyces sp. 'palustris']|nr:hypothetical protein SpCBS45565_g00870 [Spizellomyces sp. 'palustris']